ncbi:dolichyl-phosphate-mannose-protein mannosyltransferase [Hamiltosporidium tvaerminnensis]|uniref:Dolichyl-phosphate-mannose--protein mannosyltransferase n=1 Tax=Hamiltosporidium tvaerminnensis TaxID=1176355 RepID=A0A4Q9LV57_9MICR|nr:dolichyl-phosphate-mannose-protein mannosyltransferase [Hamiltosporidium tvaerminnensis]
MNRQFYTSTILFLLDFTIKTFKIENGNFVIWDEAHFGKFAQRYANREFYFDVHPPLGKMMTAVSNVLFNMDREFKFESSEEYPTGTDYPSMRRFHAFISSFIPLLAYLTLINLQFTHFTSLITALLLVFENGMVSISRLILLDSHLLFFTALTTYFLTRYLSRKYLIKDQIINKNLKNICEIIETKPYIEQENEIKSNSSKNLSKNVKTGSNIDKEPKPDPSAIQDKPSNNQTYLNYNPIPTLLFLGLSIGCVLGVKWIGCLTTLYSGLPIIFILYKKLINKDYSLLNFTKKLTALSILLILTPISIYILFFILHFRILIYSGSDDSHMSSLFQSRLVNSEIGTVNKYINYGTVVTLKSSKNAGGNLHSHQHSYPDTPGNHYQITTYHHSDTNNNWAFQKVTDTPTNPRFLGHNDKIVLYHTETQQYLSVLQNRVTSSPLTTASIWTLEIVTDILGKEHNVKTLTTRFRLKNVESGCYLSSSNNNYPSWGYNQGEVVCTKKKDVTTLWNIESNPYKSNKEEHNKESNQESMQEHIKEGNDENLQLVNPEYREVRNLQTFFISHFLHLNTSMFLTNKSFTQEKDLEPVRLVSKPIEWFILRRGLRMTGWSTERPKFYMFGNPISWYLSNICVLIGPLILLIKTIKIKRNLKNRLDPTIRHNIARDYLCIYLFTGGWLLHYIPFFFVGRVLYFHHYFPALFFSILSTSYVLQHTRKISIFILFICILTFFLFSPLTYGIVNIENMKYFKWISTWDFT